MTSPRVLRRSATWSSWIRRCAGGWRSSPPPVRPGRATISRWTCCTSTVPTSVSRPWPRCWPGGRCFVAERRSSSTTTGTRAIPGSARRSPSWASAAISAARYSFTGCLDQTPARVLALAALSGQLGFKLIDQVGDRFGHARLTPDLAESLGELGSCVLDDLGEAVVGLDVAKFLVGRALRRLGSGRLPSRFPRPLARGLGIAQLTFEVGQPGLDGWVCGGLRRGRRWATCGRFGGLIASQRKDLR